MQNSIYIYIYCHEFTRAQDYNGSIPDTAEGIPAFGTVWHRRQAVLIFVQSGLKITFNR